MEGDNIAIIRMSEVLKYKLFTFPELKYELD